MVLPHAFKPKPWIFTTPGRGRAALLLAVVLLGSGCAAITNPVADGLPVGQLPDEFRGKSREGLTQIPLNDLRQKPVDAHIVGPNDVLGIVIDNVLGRPGEMPPSRLTSEPGQAQTPAIGYPILVQENGTIVLPYIKPLNVNGKTLFEVQELLRIAYTLPTKEGNETKPALLKAGQERILVTLYQPRKYRVLVMREDGGSAGSPAGPAFGSPPLVGASKKGTGYNLDLPYGENDVLNALARTGGLPGTDAKNEVILYKKALYKKEGMEPVVIHIPLRTKSGDKPTFHPADVILDNGDIVYLESRDTEVFYTAGLLGTGVYPLPRDNDMDVVQAVTFVKAPLLNGGFGQAQFVASAVQTGLGFESPSLVTVLRKTASGRQLPIRIDLNHAMKDPRDRIIIQPGDILVMQEKPDESLGRYLSQKINVNITGFFTHTKDIIIQYLAPNLIGP